MEGEMELEGVGEEGRAVSKPIPIAGRASAEPEGIPLRGEGAEAARARSCPESASACLLFLEEEEDCCCICLESFGDDNPAKATKCGHEYHLQCIMQWYQRNRCCPMCFKEIELVDEGCNELLVCVADTPDIATQALPNRPRIVRTREPLAYPRERSMSVPVIGDTPGVSNRNSNRRFSLSSALRKFFSK